MRIEHKRKSITVADSAIPLHEDKRTACFCTKKSQVKLFCFGFRINNDKNKNENQLGKNCSKNSSRLILFKRDL